jgi:hypothetical protein
MLFSGWLRDRTQRLFGWCAFAGAVLSTLDCSALVDAERVQCATDADCQNRGGEFTGSLCQNTVCITDPTWGCVGSVVWSSPPPVPSPEKVSVKLTLSNLLTKDVVVGATARVCGKLDPKCDSPVQTDLQSDSEGILAVQVSKYFDGYFEIKFPNMVDTMYFFNPPVETERVVPFVPLVPFEALTVFGDQLKMAPRVDRGTTIVLSYDCQGASAAGVELSADVIDEYTAPFYMVHGFPSLEATHTDVSGQGGIANVAPGPRLISGRRADTSAEIGAVTVQLRPLWITYTSMLPTPLSTQK